jgi:transcriptional regulator with XRE-family HTH domain
MKCLATKQGILKAKIASKLKRLRIEEKLSQKEVALSLMIDQSHLSLIENSKISPRIETIALLLSVYNLSVSEFFQDINY